MRAYAVTAVDPADFSSGSNGIAWTSATGKIWCRIWPGEYGSGCQMSATANGYTCTSRETGMTCTTPTGHGFEMSMQVARSF